MKRHLCYVGMPEQGMSKMTWPIYAPNGNLYAVAYTPESASRICEGLNGGELSDLQEELDTLLQRAYELEDEIRNIKSGLIDKKARGEAANV